MVGLKLMFLIERREPHRQQGGGAAAEQGGGATLRKKSSTGSPRRMGRRNDWREGCKTPATEFPPLDVRWGRIGARMGMLLLRLLYEGVYEVYDE